MQAQLVELEHGLLRVFQPQASLRCPIERFLCQYMIVHREKVPLTIEGRPDIAGRIIAG